MGEFARRGAGGFSPKRGKGYFRCFVGLAFLALAAMSLCARHPANVPSAQLKVAADGSVELHIRFDILAFLLEETPQEIADGPMNALLDGPQSVLQDRLGAGSVRLKNQLGILCDNGPATFGTLRFPSAADVLRCAAENGPRRLPVMLTAVLPAQLPAGAKTVACRFPDVLGAVVLTTEMPYEEPVSEPVEPGDTSSALQIPTAAQIAASAASMRQTRPPPLQHSVEPASKTDVKTAGTTSAGRAPAILNSADQSSTISPVPESGAKAARAASRQVSSILLSIGRGLIPGSEQPLPKASAPDAKVDLKQVPAVAPGPVSRASVEPKASLPAPLSPVGRPPWYLMFGKYVRMGYKHILPQGLDHILFVLGLFLLSRKTKSLLTQISAFTVAHSITLGLSLYGVIQLPSTIVEPLIALSIVFVAVENLFTTEMKAWRPVVVFGFGLVHGLGFAGALKDAGLAHGDFLTGLVGFNSGVELGQLSVVALAFLAVGWWRSSPRYRSLVVMPASAAIAAVAIFWTIQRVGG
jgi:hypothetical protein